MTHPIGPRATLREWIGLAVLALPCMLYSMDLTVLNLAVPHLSAALKPSSTQMLWIVDIYGFMLAGALITMGTLGDRIGRRRLLLTGAACFGGASVLAAFSTSAEMLIATRALLGLAGATLAPSTLSLIRNMFLDDHQRTVAIGVWVASYSAGAAIGPLVGGFLLEHFWWGSVFLAGVPVMVLLLVLGPMLLPECQEAEGGRIDLLSAAQSLVAVLAVIYGLKRIAEDGAVHALPLALIAAGLAVGWVFVRRQRRLAAPLMDLALFRNPLFSVALVIYTLNCFVAFGAFLFLPQYTQMVLGLSPLEAGLWSLPSALAFIAGSMIAPLAVRRVRPGLVVAAGLLAAAVGFAILTQLSLERGAGLTLLVTGSVVFSLGLAQVFTLATDLIVGAAAPERAGAASAISETAAEFGGALGIAMLGSLMIALYRGAMDASALAGVPGTMAEAARDTLGAAADAAAQLSGPVGAALLQSARAAFTQAFEATAWVCVVVALLSAVLAAVMLRRGGDSSSGQGVPATAQ